MPTDTGVFKTRNGEIAKLYGGVPKWRNDSKDKSHSYRYALNQSTLFAHNLKRNETCLRLAFNAVCLRLLDSFHSLRLRLAFTPVCLRLAFICWLRQYFIICFVSFRRGFVLFLFGFYYIHISLADVFKTRNGGMIRAKVLGM